MQKYYVSPGKGENTESFTVSFAYFLSLSLRYSGSPAKILPLIVFQYLDLNPIVQNTFCKNIMFLQAEEQTQSPFYYFCLFSLTLSLSYSGPKQCKDFATISFSIFGSKPNCAKHFLQKYYVSPFRGANSESFSVTFVYLFSHYHWVTAAYQAKH
jgi:hypothetical protein